jgi:hypothetical protein
MGWQGKNKIFLFFLSLAPTPSVVNKNFEETLLLNVVRR